MMRLWGVAVVLAAVLLFARGGLGTNRLLSGPAMTTMNWLRGLSAVAVLIGHVRGLFMHDFETLQHPSLIWKAFYLVSGLGHQAVIVFFILSGFLVGSTVLARSADGRWDFRDYFTRRMARLYVVLVPGLLLTAAWDATGMHLFGTEGLYGGVLAARHLDMPDVRVTLSWGHFLGNLAFLQHLFISPFGSNGPLWSLPYEFWAYMLFPLLVHAGSSSTATPRRVAYVVGACVVVVAGGWKLGLYLGVWLIGAVLALWWRRTSWAAAPLWLGLGLGGVFSFAIVLGRVSKIGDTYTDLLLGVATACLLAAVLTKRDAVHTSAAGKLSAKGAGALADFSYTLYVAHYPVLTFLSAAFMSGERWPAGADAIAAVLAISLLIMIYAFLLSRVTEAHTDRVRAWLSPKKA